MPDVDLGYLGFRAGSLIARAVPGPIVTPFTRAASAVAERTMGSRKLIV